MVRRINKQGLMGRHGGESKEDRKRDAMGGQVNLSRKMWGEKGI